MTTPAPPRRRWFRYSLRTLFVLVTLLAVGVCIVVVPPSVSTKLTRASDGGLELDIQQNFKVNYIMAINLTDAAGVRIWEWKRELNEEPPQRVTIHLHDQGNGGRGHMTRPIPVGELFSVQATFQFDQGLAPCMGSQTFRFRSGSDGPEFLGSD